MDKSASTLLLVLLSPLLTSASWLPFSYWGAETVELEVAQGKLQGIKQQSERGRDYFLFEGIPYGKPPVGDLRFRRPEPADPWEGTLDATRHVMCPQVQPFLELATMGQEDCLVLNVYTPELPGTAAGDAKAERLKKKKKEERGKAVMVWIHGGGFWFGSGVDFRPNLAMDKEIVLVTVNYRLGALGFLSTGDDVMPANLGLWDQVLALRWVRDNVAQFGGDPDKVTIFGESAGGFSVFNQLMSPSSRGLYRAAIAQSGVSGTTWAATDRHPAYYARSVAGEVGCHADGTHQEILECLKKVEAKDLVNKATYAFDQFEHYPHAFQPILDNDTSVPFFPKDPLDIVQEGSFVEVPLIFGTTANEGLFLKGQIERDSTLVEKVDKDWEESLALFMFGRNADDITERDRTHMRLMEEAYFKGSPNPTRKEKFEALVEIYEDSVFRAIGAKMGRAYAEKSKEPVYEYLYSHRATLSLYNVLTLPVWEMVPLTILRAFGWDLFPEPPGTCHHDDTFIMFGNRITPFSPISTNDDAKASDNLWMVLSNFAKHLKPMPYSKIKWEKLDPAKPRHLEIGASMAMKEDSPEFRARLSRWEKIWAETPPRFHNSKESPTWKDPTLHKRKQKSARTEL